MMKPLNWRLGFLPRPGLQGVSEFVEVVVFAVADVAAVVLTLIPLRVRAAPHANKQLT